MFERREIGGQGGRSVGRQIRDEPEVLGTERRRMGGKEIKGDWVCSPDCVLGGQVFVRQLPLPGHTGT